MSIRPRTMRRRWAAVVVAALVLAFASSAPLGAEEPLTVNVTSVDPAEYPLISAVIQIGGTAALSGESLDATAFSIMVDDIAVDDVEITPTNTEPLPTATLLLIDESGSMKGLPAEEARAAAQRYIEAMRPVDLVAVYAFNDGWRMLSDFSADKQALIQALAALEPRRETALYDGVRKSVDAFKDVPSTTSRYLVVLSDGGDTASTGTLDETLAAVRVGGVRLYAVGLKGGEFDPAPLLTMAETGGGRYLEAPTPADLATLYESLAREIQNQYVVRIRMPEGEQTREAGRVSIGVTIGEATSAGERGFFYPESARSNTTTTEAADDTAVVTPKPSEPRSNLVAAVVGWNGSDYGVALLAALLLLCALWVLSRVLFPKRNILAEYADVLENRQSLGASSREESDAGRISSVIERLMVARGWQGPLDSRIEDAGWRIRSSEFFMIQMGIIAVVTIGLTLLQLPGYLTVVVLVFITLAPLLYLDSRAKKRRTAFEAQVPDALIMMANALRAGQGFEQAMRVVAEEGPDPSAHEFKRVLAQQRLGVPPDETLRTLADRMGSEAFDWVVMATTIQREVGGNLAEIYDNIADTLRQRAILRGEIRTLTAEGRISALILILLPFGVAGAMAVVNPSYISLLVTTKAGLVMIGAALLAMVMGALWLRRIIRFDV